MTSFVAITICPCGYGIAGQTRNDSRVGMGMWVKLAMTMLFWHPALLLC